MKMGKSLTQQKRGKGSPTWRSPKHKYAPSSGFSGQEGKAVVVDIFRDSQRSAPLAIVRSEKGVFVVPAADGLGVGQIIEIGSKTEPAGGDIVPLESLSEGDKVFCIERVPGDGGKLVRGAGGSATLMAKGRKTVRIKLPSGAIKDLPKTCKAVVGTAAGLGIREKPVLKAGKKFHMMKAKHTYWPRVAASSMNACEHPFGGGRKHRHAGKPQTSSRNAPPGRKVGYIAARRTGRKR